MADDAPEVAIPALAAAGLRTIPPREIGGNTDVRGFVAGSTVYYLPVHVPGALFSLGDLHFAQGDGETLRRRDRDRRGRHGSLRRAQERRLAASLSRVRDADRARRGARFATTGMSDRRPTAATSRSTSTLATRGACSR